MNIAPALLFLPAYMALLLSCRQPLTRCGYSDRELIGQYGSRLVMVKDSGGHPLELKKTKGWTRWPAAVTCSPMDDCGPTSFFQGSRSMSTRSAMIAWGI